MEVESVMRSAAFRALSLAAVVTLATVTLGDPAFAKMKDGPKIPPEAMAKLKQYDSAYYVFYSDLEPAKVQAAIARMTSVARTYYDRTKGFAGQIKSKWPLYLIADPQLYQAAGGQAYGVTWGDRLMGRADRPDELWHVVQHEAFHQFAHTVISENLPGWIDEGMAEYFGESLWTGDGLTCGVIPKKRYESFMPRLKAGKIKPFKEIILVKAANWGGIEDYDQALTMIHFFVHAQNGKYRNALSACIKSAVGGASFEQSFVAGFGRDIDAVQKEYLAWWSTQPESITERPYAQATVATLTGLLGRAWSQNQKFDTVDDFLKAAREGTLKSNPKQSLPDDLLKEALGRADKLKDWSLEQASKAAPPKLALKQADGTTYTGSFTVSQGLVSAVNVEVKEPIPPTDGAKPQPAKQAP
jgi:hypothetical protein